MAEREHILADFQACTGLENIDECIAVLQQHDWNLMSAVQSAMASLDLPEGPTPSEESVNIPSDLPPSSYGAAETATQSSRSLPTSSLEDRTSFRGSFRPIHADPGSAASSSSGFSPFYLARTLGGGDRSVLSSMASGSAVTSRFLYIDIEFRDRSIPLVLSDLETVGRIKELLENELGISQQQMVLKGWFCKWNESHSDKTILRDLNLPEKNNLILLTPNRSPSPAVPSNDESVDLLGRLLQTFTLNIRYTDRDASYKLNFPGSRTIQEVKGDVYSLIDVPVRHQVWMGWPDDASDETMTLAGCGVRYPHHSLEVSKAKPEGSSSKGQNDSEDVMEICGSEDEFEDAHETFNLDEDLFEPSGPRKPMPMIPEEVHDQTAALESFTTEFIARYGDTHPVFYIGSLEDALKEALHVRAKDRKLLAIYLHHDKSILSNVFCSSVLCAESVVSYLSNNFITWAWDVTTDINKARLLRMCTQHFGSVAASAVRNFEPDQLPLLLIINRSRSVSEIINVIHANITLDELMTQLVQVIDIFTDQQSKDIQEEHEREARESMLKEQDKAYQMSLAADKAKAEVKRQEEEAQKKQKEEKEIEQMKAKALKQQEEMEKEAIRQSILDHMPDEPSENTSEPVSQIRIRLPGGENISRRFLACEPLQVLLHFIVTKGFATDCHKVLTTFPRRDLTELDPKTSLYDLKLYPQETVTLEEI